MKLHKPNIDNVISGGIKDQRTFSLAPTAEAFRILSSGMYTDPITAIIRELSCNAWDSHVTAGNVEKPFDVSMPGRFSPLWKIRDYGTGLSHESVMNLYVTYFNSTKTNDNTTVGALGIGSKSPLGYTQSFSVVSYFEGNMNIYSVFIGDENSENPGFPSIAFTGSIPSSEPSGMEISVPTQDNDFAKWESAAKKVYKWFSVIPNFIENPIEVNKPIVERSVGKVHITRMANGNNDWYVVQGNIAYPLNLSLLDPHYHNLYRGMNGYIVVDIGEVMMAANRETLNYTKETIAALEASLAEFERVFEEKVANEVKVCTTYNKAHALYYEIKDSNYLSKCKVMKLAEDKVCETLAWLFDDPVHDIDDPNKSGHKITAYPPVKIGDPKKGPNGRFTMGNWNPLQYYRHDRIKWDPIVISRAYQLATNGMKDKIADENVRFFNVDHSAYTRDHAHTVRQISVGYNNDGDKHYNDGSMKNGLIIIYNDTTRSALSTVHTHLREAEDIKDNTLVILINEYADVKYVKELEKFFVEHELPLLYCKPLSEIELYKKKGDTRLAAAGVKTSMLQWDGFKCAGSWAKGSCLQTLINNTTKIHYWFTCKNVESIDTGTNDPQTMLGTLRLYDANIKEICGIKEKDVHLVKGLPNWIHFNDAVAHIVKKALTSEVLEAHGRNYVLKEMSDIIFRIHSHNLLNTIECPDFKDLARLKVQKHNTDVTVRIKLQMEYAEKHNISVPNSDITAIADKLKQVYNRVIGLQTIVRCCTSPTENDTRQIIRLVNHFYKQENQQ